MLWPYMAPELDQWGTPHVTDFMGPSWEILLGKLFTSSRNKSQGSFLKYVRRKGTLWRKRTYTNFVVVVQLLRCLTLCDPMDCDAPGLPVPHYLLEFAQVHVHWVHDAMRLTILSSATLFSFCPQLFSASGYFPTSPLFASGSQSIGGLASASVLPVMFNKI